MSTHRLLPLLLAAATVAPAAARAQIAEAVGALPAPPTLAVVLEATDDSPRFAAQRAATRLQNAAEVVRQLGDRVTRTDTAALGVTRRPEVDRRTGYPPPPYVARYVLRVRVARDADVQEVATALAAAGASAVRVTQRRGER